MARRVLIAVVLVGAILASVLLVTTGGPETPVTPQAGEPEAGPDHQAEAADPGRPEDPLDIDENDLTNVLAPDSIPSIDDPKFVSPAEADFVRNREPVVAIDVDGDRRAYPLSIMTWHEIVNDVVGGVPVAVTYCPLCNSALAYKREVNGEVLEFGTTGSLYNSALVMWDRNTGSKWLHFEGLAVIGELEGTQLEFVPVQIVSFGDWKRENPDGKVLSDDTGFSRPYGTNPYDFYDTNEDPFLFEGEIDDRLPAVERVVGVEIEGEAVAFPYGVFRKEGDAAVAQETVGGTDIVVFWESGVASALDAPTIAQARDVGTSGVFVPRAGGQRLTFEVRDTDFVDAETGSTWSISGRATAGPLEGEQLKKVNHLDSFWFAWAAFNPETAVFGL